jgi:hypothetical protein
MQKLVDHVPPIVEKKAPGYMAGDEEWFSGHGWVSVQELIDLGYRKVTDQHGVRIWQSPYCYDQGRPVYRGIPEGTADYHANNREKGIE